MKKHSNIPLKERKRNADRCYRHEERLEEIAMRKLAKEQERCKREAHPMSDKEQQEAEAFAALLNIATKGGAE